MRKFWRLFVFAIALIAVIAILAPAGINAKAQQNSGTSNGTYVVQPGDSLFTIAARFNVSISLLATINRVYDVNQVYVGQVMTLPAPLPAGSPQNVPAGGQNGQFGTGGPYPSLPAYTAPIYTPPVVTYPVYASGTTVTTVTTYTSYIVRPGDFLSGIADKFKTTPEAILSANAINNPNLVYVGQLLSIPRINTTVVPKPVYYPVPVRSGNYYIVQPGDNLFGIAARTGRNAWSIARANGILNLNAIYVGQPLLIP